MKKKNSSVLQRCVLFTKCPTDEVCHQAGPGERDHRAGDEDHDERGEREDAEDVDPRGDVDGLRVGQELVGRQRRRRRRRARARSRSELRAPRSSPSSSIPGTAAQIARAKTAIIRATTTRFAIGDQEPAFVDVARGAVEIDRRPERG